MDITLAISKIDQFVELLNTDDNWFHEFQHYTIQLLWHHNSEVVCGVLDLLASVFDKIQTIMSFISVGLLIKLKALEQTNNQEIIYRVIRLYSFILEDSRDTLEIMKNAKIQSKIINYLDHDSEKIRAEWCWCIYRL